MRRTFLHSMNGKLVRHSTAVYQSSAVEFTVGSHDRAYHSIQTPGFFWSNRLWVRMSRHYIHTAPSVNYCSAWDCNTLTHLLQSIWNTISSWKYSMLWSLPHVWMHSRGKTMPLCLCVCRQKNIDTSSRVAKATQRKQSYWNISVPDTSQGGSFRHYFSCFLLSVSWLHPFLIARGSYGQQLIYTKMRSYSTQNSTTKRHTG